jgi:hypothetical protein
VLLEVPDLRGFSEQKVVVPYPETKEFMSKMFQDSTGNDVGNATVERARSMNSSDGIIEKHHRYGTHVDQWAHVFEGKCVIIDEPVCVIGYFSQRENGFISDTTVHRGTPEIVLSRISNGIDNVKWRLRVGLACLGAAGIWLGIFD